MTFSVRIPLPEYEVVDFASGTHVVTERDLLDYGHKGWIDNGVFRGGWFDLVLDTTLCKGCDGPVGADMVCHDCQHIFYLDAKDIGDGFYRVEA